ncbi:unnamed protein product [Cladocopium goreaui]|uniref:Uncharacterized protein n=1 Tax=Cladocopium goreaui TaxID=2562237 RepID=A0A9P1DHS7_9DINO|nr:unnamed protein product [Cladocopium goreaui]
MTSTHANSAVSALSATSFQADAGKVPKAPKTEAGANRGLLQKMLSNVMDEEDEVDADDEDADSGERDGQLGMSLRSVTSHPQPRGKVPTITSPPTGRPGSRGGPGAVRRMSLESQGRPLSRGERSTPSSSRVTVTTGAPRPALATYVSQPRPGSRGGSMPTAEVITSPGRKPAVGTQPKSKSAAMPKAAGYAGLHQARVSPSSAASAAKSLVPAAKPRCGPSAFDLVKKLKQAEDPEEDEGNFIMPPGRRFAAQVPKTVEPTQVTTTYPQVYGRVEETVMSPYKGGPVYLWLRSSIVWLRRFPGRHWMRWIERNSDYQKMCLMGMPEFHIDPTKNRWRYYIDTSYYGGMLDKSHEDFYRYILLYPAIAFFLHCTWCRIKDNDKDNFLAKWRVPAEEA